MKLNVDRTSWHAFQEISLKNPRGNQKTISDECRFPRNLREQLSMGLGIYVKLYAMRILKFFWFSFAYKRYLEGT